MMNRSGYNRVRLVEGIVLIVMGVLTLIRPDIVYSSAVVLYGILAVGIGILDIVSYVRQETFFGFGSLLALVTGIFSVMIGCMLLLHPNVGKMVMGVLFAGWFIAHCISRLTRLQFIRFAFGNVHYYFTMFVNIAGIFLGFFMLMTPQFAFVTLEGILGIYLILLGIDSVWLGGSGKGSL